MAKTKKPNVTHEGAETEYFRFYKSFLDAMRGYDDEIQFRAFKFIANYGIYGIVPELKDGDVASTIFLLCKPYIDSAYRRAKNGQEHKAKTELEEPAPQEKKKPGRPRKAAAAPESTPESGNAEIPLLEPADEGASHHTTELPESVGNNLLIDSKADESAEPTAADLRITPPKKESKKVVPKVEYGAYGNVRLSDDDYKELCKEKGKEATDEAIEWFDKYIEALSTSMKREYRARDQAFTMRDWVFNRIEDEKIKAKKRTAESDKVVPIVPPGSKNNFLNFEQNTYSAEEMQELEAKLLENY